MALNKLPCEYPALERIRWKECFGDLSEKEQKQLKEVIERMSRIVKV